jgi:uncharacterized membrane protein
MQLKFLLSVVLFFIAQLATAQQEVEMADKMRSEGKIYVVVGIILIVLVGLIAYLFLLDKKVNKLEEQLKNRR